MNLELSLLFVHIPPFLSQFLHDNNDDEDNAGAKAIAILRVSSKTANLKMLRGTELNLVQMIFWTREKECCSQICIKHPFAIARLARQPNFSLV